MPHYRTSSISGALLALTLLATSVEAQAIYGAAEVDDNETSLFFIGGSWGLPGMGWHPYVAVSAYHLRFDAGASTVSRNVILPAVGMVNRSETGSLGFSVGYAFADVDVSEPILIGAESGDGVVGSAQWNHWGRTGRHNLQLLASYNFGTEFLWTRGRASKPLTATSPLWVGGEAALMGGGSSDAYLAQFGPMVEYRFSPQFRLGGSAGLKVGVSNVGGGSAAYGRVEFLWLPRAQ